mmetsp:Transcript_57952/g.172950  ORF Transcript_57952/g.172950 Transcript_57952/m.172950 type:complete len:364 (-) Transcript_57952:10-1101(-)
MIALHFIKLIVFLAAGCSVARVLSSFSLPVANYDAVEKVLMLLNLDRDGAQKITEKQYETDVGESTKEGPKSRRPHNRFPRFGTAEFDTKCGWTTDSSPSAPGAQGCSLLARPSPNSGEGLSAWTSQIAAGYMYAKQTGCRLLIDYGEDINIEQIFMPPKGSSMNWSVPKNFTCRKENHCKVVYALWNAGNLKHVAKDLGVDGTTPIIVSPDFRWPHQNRTNEKSTSDELKNLTLRKTFPGFDFETGFGCSFGHTFDLSPTASAFEPNLFSTILPTLRNERSFVISLYIRTGRTDHVYQMEKKGESVEEDNTSLRGNPQSVINCALRIEEDLLGNNSQGGYYTSLTWMVLTDAPNVGHLVKSA